MKSNSSNDIEQQLELLQQIRPAKLRPEIYKQIVQKTTASISKKWLPLIAAAMLTGICFNIYTVVEYQKNSLAQNNYSNSIEYTLSYE